MFEYQFWSLNFNSWYCFSSIQWSIFWRYDSMSGDTTKFSDWNTSFYPWDFFDLQFRTIPWYFNKKQHCIKHHSSYQHCIKHLVVQCWFKTKSSIYREMFLCIQQDTKLLQIWKYNESQWWPKKKKKRKFLRRPENLWAIITLTEIPTSWVFSTIQKLG